MSSEVHPSGEDSEPSIDPRESSDTIGALSSEAPCQLQPLNLPARSFRTTQAVHSTLGRLTTQTTRAQSGHWEDDSPSCASVDSCSLSPNNASMNSNRRSILPHSKSERGARIQASVRSCIDTGAREDDGSDSESELPWHIRTRQRFNLLIIWVIFIVVLGSCIGLFSVLFHWTVHSMEHLFSADICANYPAEEAANSEACKDTHGTSTLGVYIALKSVVVVMVAEITCYLSTVYMPEIHGGGILPVKVCLAVGASVPARVGVMRFIISGLYLGFGNPLGAETPTLHYACAVACSLYSLASYIVGSKYFPEGNKTSMVLMGCVCGMAAAFDSVLAGMIYHVEHFSHGSGFMLQRLLGFYTMFACLMSCIVSRLMWSNLTPHWHSGVNAEVKNEQSIVNMGKSLTEEKLDVLFLVILAIGAGIIFGIISHAFLMFTVKLRLFLAKHIREQYHGLISGTATSILAGMCFYVTRFNGVWGVGWDSLSRILTNAHTVNHRFIFLLAKFFACCFAVACGGNGGIFGPALVIGGASGSVLSEIFDSGTVAYKVLPVLGMCGVFSGIHRLPLTAIVVCYEFVELGPTSDNLIFLMLGVSFVAELTASELSELDIFGVMMLQDGVNPDSFAGCRLSLMSCGMQEPPARTASATRRSLWNVNMSNKTDQMFRKRMSVMSTNRDSVNSRGSTTRHADLLRCVASRNANTTSGVPGPLTNASALPTDAPPRQTFFFGGFSGAGRRSTRLSTRESNVVDTHLDDNLVRMGLIFPAAANENRIDEEGEHDAPSVTRSSCIISRPDGDDDISPLPGRMTKVAFSTPLSPQHSGDNVLS